MAQFVEMKFPIPDFDGTTTVHCADGTASKEPQKLVFEPEQRRRGTRPVAYVSVKTTDGTGEKVQHRAILTINTKTGRLSLQSVDDGEGDDDTDGDTVGEKATQRAVR
jgi:hypothetical protein